MHGTTAHRHCRPHAENVPYVHRPYWGWSHRNQRMEFMDLPSYMDSFQQGYNAALQQLGLPAAAAATGPATGSQPLATSQLGQVQDWHGYQEHGHREHRHHGHHEHGYHEHGARQGWHCGCEHQGCGCGCEHTRERHDGYRHEQDCDGCGDHRCQGDCWRRERDCRCDCCIADADIIVYAHCGEVRVVPIEVANDTRKVRDDVEVQVSDVRSGGGTVLAWPAEIRPNGPLTLQPCSTTKLELLVHVVCGAQRDDTSATAAGGTAGPASAAPSGTKQSEPAGAVATLVKEDESAADVDRCEVGYVTIRLGGCLIRPIVVAIAVLPLGCDSYRAGCACSCCC
jgi:hypothetical protein